MDDADFLFANINRNIITGDINSYSKRLKSGGEMLLSGFYDSDIEIVEAAAAPYGLKEIDRLVSPAGWTALRLKKD